MFARTRAIAPAMIQGSIAAWGTRKKSIASRFAGPMALKNHSDRLRRAIRMSYERPRGNSLRKFFLSGLKCFLSCRSLCNMKILLHTIVLSMVLGAGSVGCSKEGAAAKQVNVPAMIDALKGQDSDARINACVELAKAGPRAKAAIPSLIRLLKDQD